MVVRGCPQRKSAVAHTADPLRPVVRPHHPPGEPSRSQHYAHAAGFRGDSDRADAAGFDETVQAASGLVDIADRALGTPLYLPTILADKVSGLTIAYSVLAALVYRTRTGPGQQIEIPMADTLITFNQVEHLAGHTFEPATGPTGYAKSPSSTTGRGAPRTAWPP
ncbi:CoA transferase [Streptomyces sp. NPDC059909]|uniref:CoA transferase n=1 Tax=Streptomyces sp. NPDC059909 TaxID=3346998 RepID=UPI00365042DA